MTSTEQLQLGGIANVRGYPAAEKVGDYGVSTSAELSIPVYIIPKNIKIPFTKTMLYDAVRLVAFYDYGAVRLRRPLSTEKKFDQLSGAGFGVRFNLPRSVYLRADFAWALDKKPSDDNNFHAWLQASVTY
jgi:hemolysin activation/secretion protein